MNTAAYRSFERFVADRPLLVAQLARATDRASFVSAFLELGRVHSYTFEPHDVEAGIDEDIAAARVESTDADIVGGQWLYKGSDTSTSNYVCCGGSCSSDMRLKRDVRYVEPLPSGLKLHSFRYWNDSRTFVSVIAQELLEDERFRGAVFEHESGYYMVDLAALKLDFALARKDLFKASWKAITAAPRPAGPIPTAHPENLS